MNHPALSSYGKVTKPNGQIYPSLKRFFKESKCIPFPEIALPWMEREQKFTYASNDMNYQVKAIMYQEEITRPPEIYYQNRLFEALVGAILREYLKKNDPNATFYYASRYDDLFSAFDYIICRGNEYVRVDLTMTRGKVGSIEENYIPPTIKKKMDRFHEKPGIPQEFFRSVRPDESPKDLPLIILQINYSVLSSFAYDFFHTMANHDKKISVSEYFSSWICSSLNAHKNDCACIISMTKSAMNGTLYSDQVANVTKHMRMLFPAVSNTMFVSDQ